MTEDRTPFAEAVVISVERLIRFCYLVQIMLEQEDPRQSRLPPDLTRCGTLLFLTGSFLYSLFDDGDNAINLVRVWSGFPHPFREELHNIAAQLEPLKNDLRYVRNRYGFHGSLSRTREAKGLSIFAEPQGQALRAVIGRMLLLAGQMIPWHMEHLGHSDLIPAFRAQLFGVGEQEP